MPLRRIGSVIVARPVVALDVDPAGDVGVAVADVAPEAEAAGAVVDVAPVAHGGRWDAKQIGDLADGAQLVLVGAASVLPRLGDGYDVLLFYGGRRPGRTVSSPV